jgi:hypothetical protein
MKRNRGQGLVVPLVMFRDFVLNVGFKNCVCLGEKFAAYTTCPRISPDLRMVTLEMLDACGIIRPHGQCTCWRVQFTGAPVKLIIRYLVNNVKSNYGLTVLLMLD